MRTLVSTIILALHIVGYSQVSDTLKKSIPKNAELKIVRAQFRVSYYAPNVRNRIIYGGLVPFDEVWVTGAHSATSFEFNVPITIGGKEIVAGKYAFFTIPGKDTWTIIINKNYKQHLADNYDEKEDVLRFTVTPNEGPLRERLDYRLEKISDKEIKFVFRWEKVLISFPITINSNKPAFKMEN
jgi:Protein of unknown function (DUF2911)